MSKYLRGSGAWHLSREKKTVIASVGQALGYGCLKVREYPVVVKYVKRRHYVKPTA